MRSSSLAVKAWPPIALTAASAVMMRSSRLGLAGSAISARMASGFGSGRPGRPVVDMIDTRLFILEGWLIATSCAIMPPIDAPTTCARSIPSASSKAAASAAMSSSE